MAQDFIRSLSEAWGEKQFAIDRAAIETKIGERIAGPALPDRRSWWQRTAPKWLGGKDAPRPLNAVITATGTGGR
jgi:hypothetical protein